MRRNNIGREIWARRRVLGLAPLIALTLGGGEGLMSEANTTGSVKNVVLVHGAFADGSGWEGVYRALKRDGYSVSIVQNPVISLRVTWQRQNGRWPRRTVLPSWWGTRGGAL